MKFEENARDWLARQTLSKDMHKTTRQSMDYICDAIGEKEISDIEEADIDQIFFNVSLFHRQIDFMERTFRVLNSLFDEMIELRIIRNDPVLHIYCPVVLSHEKLILGRIDVELTEKSPFVDVSCMWLKKQGYMPVTFNLYNHFLNAFIHPFIGKKPIGLIDQNNIRRIYTYFNTLNTNETWIGQMHLVMRMVFQYAMDKTLISANPLMKINDPHLEPLLELDRGQKNAVRVAFGKFGFRKTKLRQLSKELYGVLHTEVAYNNRDGIRANDITFRTVFEQWHLNTQDGVLAEATSKSSFHSMDVYLLPNIGDKPIQKISVTDLRTVLNVYSLMGNTSDWYIIAKVRSLYDYAIEKGYVSENLGYQLKSANHPAAVKYVLSDTEIQEFFMCCDEMYSMYSFMFAVILCTGLRIREAMALACDQVDYELKTVRIQSIIKNGKLVPTVKTRRGRKIKLSRTALAYMEAAKNLRQEYQQNPNYFNEYGLVFTTEEGKPLSYTNINRKLDEIALQLGRADITNHTFRHTYMTVSTRCGENLDQMQSEVGHGFASDVITEYLHQTDESIHESAIRRQEYLENVMARHSE